MYLPAACAAVSDPQRCARIAVGQGSEPRAGIGAVRERTLVLALPAKLQWTDMDLDSELVFAKVRCPVLLFYRGAG
ncbi:MAG: hypothetical protein M3076_00310 [Actinomycetota bacterium]|nr:hypothetical protein [Actinomycetota bacterium]